MKYSNENKAQIHNNNMFAARHSFYSQHIKQFTAYTEICRRLSTINAVFNTIQD